MEKTSFQFLYGPVYSWRLGMSLGVDPISQPLKICNFNCLYCQLGEAHPFKEERKIFVPTQAIVDEIKKFPFSRIDTITFSGRGEPTLAKNLGDMIQAVKAVRPEKISVITNASLIDCPDVQADLMLADFVLAKIDAFDQESFRKISQGAARISLRNIVAGLKAFQKKFKGKLALQVMLIDENKGKVKEIARLIRSIHPDEVQLNTPLRPCAVKPLSKEQMKDLKREFIGVKTISVYEIPPQNYTPLDDEKTASRHGKFKK